MLHIPSLCRVFKMRKLSVHVHIAATRGLRLQSIPAWNSQSNMCSYWGTTGRNSVVFSTTQQCREYNAHQ